MPIEKINAKIFREKLEGKIPDINYFKESSNNEKKDIIEALERVQNMYNTIASLEQQEKEGATAEELSETWKNVEESLKKINISGPGYESLGSSLNTYNQKNGYEEIKNNAEEVEKAHQLIFLCKDLGALLQQKKIEDLAAAAKEKQEELQNQEKKHLEKMQYIALKYSDCFSDNIDKEYQMLQQELEKAKQALDKLSNEKKRIDLENKKKQIEKLKEEQREIDEFLNNLEWEHAMDVAADAYLNIDGENTYYKDLSLQDLEDIRNVLEQEDTKEDEEITLREQRKGVQKRIEEEISLHHKLLDMAKQYAPEDTRKEIEANKALKFYSKQKLSKGLDLIFYGRQEKLQKLQEQFQRESEAYSEQQINTFESRNNLQRKIEGLTQRIKHIKKFSKEMKGLQKAEADLVKQKQAAGKKFRGRLGMDAFLEEIKNSMEEYTARFEDGGRKHTNTREYGAMKEMLVRIRDHRGDYPLEQLKDDLKALADKSNAYLEAKNQQFRPFPSAMRVMRIKTATALKEFAESMQEKVNSLIEQKKDIDQLKKSMQKNANAKKRNLWKSLKQLNEKTARAGKIQKINEKKKIREKKQPELQQPAGPGF